MSLSSEKIYKRKPVIKVRQHLLDILLRKYIKKVYGGVVAADTAKQIDRQLIRHEYYSDINECLFNYYRLTKHTKLLKTAEFTPLPHWRKFVEAIRTSQSSCNRRSFVRSKIDGENSRCSMTVTRSNDISFVENEEIGWGKKAQVELKRELGASFGVCIVGGTVNISSDAQQISGIFIKNIIPSSPAELCKKLKVGDRILAVNGQDVRQASQEYAINLIKNSGESIELEIQSFDLNDLAKKTNMENDTDKDKRPSEEENGGQAKTGSVVVADEATDSSNDDDSEEEESLGKVVTKMGKEIDRKSAGNIKRSKEEIRADLEPENEFGYTDRKIKKRYGNLGEVLRIKLNRSNNSMGLALAGHRDRNEMGSFIVGINPKGAASSQGFKIGDEILEINGTVLHKMCHLNASVLIKAIPGSSLEFLILRKVTAEDDIAVKVVTNFPAAFDQFDQLHSCYKNVRNVTIQKIGPSLGIMIIEGKHSELGQGIFVSDIQEGSNAEKAGLLIGEMILAVNKDLLIDCNYDAAASLLKRAEGIVSLTVCNPNQLDDKKTKSDNNKTPKRSIAGDIEVIEKPHEAEPPADPIHAVIKPNRETVIEINVNNKPLGVFVTGGKMMQPPVDGAFIVYIYSGGAANIDKRLQVFDKITEIEGKKITSEMSNEDLRKLFKRRYIMAKMTVHRFEPLPSSEIAIDISRKAGKETGFSYIECKDYGILVTEIVAGSATAFDNRLVVGDIITGINGENVRNSSFVDCVLLMKASPNTIALKVLRPTVKK